MMEKLRGLGLFKSGFEPSRRIVDTSKKYRRIVDISQKYRHISPLLFSEIVVDSIKISPNITDEQIDQLVEYSNTDEQVIRFTSDQKRFATREDFDNWLAKGKQIYTLSSPTEPLLGIVWFSNKNLEDLDQNYPFSFAIRLYSSARGKGLATPFASVCLDKFFENNLDVPGVWLETSTHNQAAIKLYQKLEFSPISQQGDRLTMVKNR